MKGKRTELENTIMAIFLKNNANSKLYNKMSDDLKNKFRSGIFVSLYNLKIPITMISSEELYLLTKCLYDNFDLFKTSAKINRTKIDPEKWFYESEITKANEINIEPEKNDKIELVLHNVDQVGENLWISSHETYKNLVDNWTSGAIKYNEETQRKGEIRVALGQILKVPKIVTKNVDEIYNKIMSKEFYPNMITLNLQKMAGVEKKFIKYNAIERTLFIEITPESSVYIIDGMHRLYAIIKVLADYPETEGFFAVRVFNEDTENAQAVILQESKGTQLDSHTLKQFDAEDPFTFVIKKLNEANKNTNMMWNKIGNNSIELEQKYCLFTNMANSLEDNFGDILKKSDVYTRQQLATYLIEFYNQFLGTYKKEFENLSDTRKTMVMADINIFSGLLFIASQLYNDESWYKSLNKILKDIDWNRNNELWEGVPTNSPNCNKAGRNKVYNCFKTVIL